MYLTAWCYRKGGESPNLLFNEVVSQHPAVSLMERLREFPEENWVLLWFSQVPEELPKEVRRYYLDCAAGGGEMITGAAGAAG